MTTTTLTRDVPAGWAIEPYPDRSWAPRADAIPFDTSPRLIKGAGAAAELVQTLNVWSADKHPADASVEPKLDGHRILCLTGEPDGLLSREGARYGAAAHCLESLHRLAQRLGGGDWMIDGEFCVPGGLKETLRAFRRNKPALAGVFWVFDAIPLDAWRRGGWDMPQAERKAMLRRAYGAEGLCRNVGLVLGHQMDVTATEIMARNLWKQGYEGLVVKDRAAGYVRGRNSGFLKLKEEN